MNYPIFLVVLMIGLSGCQALAGDDISVTLSSEMTAFATESAMIQQVAQAEQTRAVETLQASGTSVADASNVNMVLAATVQVNVPPTVEMREVAVMPSDMGSSLGSLDVRDDEFFDSNADAMEVRSLGTAKSVRASDGCTNGNVTQFTDNDERIYFTALVVGLRSGSNFSLDWTFEERLIYRSTWVADYSTGAECIWFYMEQDDAPFLSGLYTVTLYVNGDASPVQQFSISAG